MADLTVEVLGGVAYVSDDTTIEYELYDFDNLEDWIDEVEINGKRYSEATLKEFEDDLYADCVKRGVVLISVSGGVATDWYVPEGIEVDIIDHD